MNLEEFEVNGNKILLNNNISELETGVAYIEKDDEELDKTEEIKIIDEDDINEKTLTDIFGDKNE